MAQQPLVDQSHLIIEASRSHSDTPHSVGLLWTSDQPRRRDLYLTTHNTHIHDLSRIRTHNPSKQTAADPRLRPRGHWDRPGLGLDHKKHKNLQSISSKMPFIIRLLVIKNYMSKLVSLACNTFL
jgi:hypothetical protein